MLSRVLCLNAVCFGHKTEVSHKNIAKGAVHNFYIVKQTISVFPRKNAQTEIILIYPMDPFHISMVLRNRSCHSWVIQFPISMVVNSQFQWW